MKDKLTFSNTNIWPVLGLLTIIISLMVVCLPNSAFASLKSNKATFKGTASWYSTASCQREGTSGIWTASGEPFNERAMSCALPHREWYNWYKVTNISNGKWVIVIHTDYGPNAKLVKSGRVIDLSKAAFDRIADLNEGLITVKVERL